MLLVRVPSRAHIFDLILGSPPAGADVRKGTAVTEIGVRIALVIDALEIFTTEFPSYSGEIKFLAAYHANMLDVCNVL